MKRTTRVIVATALALSLGACSKPGMDAPTPAPPAGDGAAPGATNPAPTETKAPVAAAPRLALAEDRYDPVVAATGAGWLVGWTASGGDDRGASRVAVAFVPNDAAPPARLIATTTLSERDAAGLRLAVMEAVWVEGSGETRRIMARRLDPRGAVDPARAAIPLATGPNLGNPEAVVTSEGVVVAWPDGEWAHAILLRVVDGAVIKRATWRGGNARPASRFKPDDAPPNPNPERSAATGARPWILEAPGTPLEVRWEAEWWFSDDEAGRVTARHVVKWGETDGEASESEPPGSVWTWLADLDTRSPLTLLQQHDPNGGPWILKLEGLGDTPIELTRGPAGPYVADLSSLSGAAVAFHDPATSRYRVLRIDADGARHEVGLPTTAPFGEAAVSLTGVAGGDGVGVAYTTIGDGRLAVRLAVVKDGDAEGDRPGDRQVRPKAQAVSLPGRFAPSRIDAVYTGGRTLLAWQSYWSYQIRAVWLKDGAAEGAPIDLSGRSPRSEGGALAALPDGSALVAFHSCSGSSICGDAKLHVVKLTPGKGPVRQRLGQRPDDRHPRLCVGPMGPVLAVQRGVFGSVSVMWGPPEARHTVDVPTPNHSNGGFPQGLVCGEQGIFLAMSSFGRGFGKTRVDVVAIGADGEATTRETLQAPGTLWSFHGLTEDPGRIGLITNMATPVGAEVALRWHPVGGGAPTTAPLLRNMTMANPDLGAAGAGAERRFAATWYAPESDGVYAVLMAPDGRRVAGPLRLDDPAARESHAAPAIVHEGDRWAVYWHERDSLYRARPF